MRHAMSVDVEDWFQVGAFEGTIAKTDWPSCETRVERNAHACLDLFAEGGVKATLFTLGWVASRYPAVIRRAVDEGHEVASHGWDHARVFTLSPEAFRTDIARTRKTLEDASGQPVVGYRAPSFSIDRRTPWAHTILAEEGYHYSSSVAPVKHDHYGWPEAPRFAFKPLEGADLIELPVTTARVAGKTLAAGGGGFFRLLPYRFSAFAVEQVAREARPAVFYFHPWEIDPEQPRVRKAPLKSRFRHYSRLGSMRRKLARLLREYEWDRTDRVAAREAARLA
jgi:polysaccharide deacetylase family protein (PEP-CTERM system associated)